MDGKAVTISQSFCVHVDEQEAEMQVQFLRDLASKFPFSNALEISLYAKMLCGASTYCEKAPFSDSEIVGWRSRALELLANDATLTPEQRTKWQNLLFRDFWRLGLAGRPGDNDDDPVPIREGRLRTDPTVQNGIVWILGDMQLADSQSEAILEELFFERSGTSEFSLGVCSDRPKALDIEIRANEPNTVDDGDWDEIFETSLNVTGRLTVSFTSEFAIPLHGIHRLRVHTQFPKVLKRWNSPDYFMVQLWPDKGLKPKSYLRS